MYLSLKLDLKIGNIRQGSLMLAVGIDHDLHHRRTQGMHWVHVHPRGGEKNFGRNLQGKVVSAPPGRARSQIFEFLRTFFSGRIDMEGGSG